MSELDEMEPDADGGVTSRVLSFLLALAAVTFIVLLAMGLGTGCSMPFSGERDVAFKCNVLGNTFEWQSRAAGSYSAVQGESGLAGR